MAWETGGGVDSDVGDTAAKWDGIVKELRSLACILCICLRVFEKKNQGLEGMNRSSGGNIHKASSSQDQDTCSNPLSYRSHCIRYRYTLWYNCCMGEAHPGDT